MFKAKIDPKTFPGARSAPEPILGRFLVDAGSIFESTAKHRSNDGSSLRIMTSILISALSVCTQLTGNTHGIDGKPGASNCFIMVLSELECS